MASKAASAASRSTVIAGFKTSQDYFQCIYKVPEPPAGQMPLALGDVILCKTPRALVAKKKLLSGVKVSPEDGRKIDPDAQPLLFDKDTVAKWNPVTKDLITTFTKVCRLDGPLKKQHMMFQNRKMIKIFSTIEKAPKLYYIEAHNGTRGFLKQSSKFFTGAGK